MPVPLTLGVPPHPDEHPLTARLLLPASGTVGITSPLVGALDADVVYVARPVDAEAVRELVGVGAVTGLDLTGGERSDGKFDARGERSDGKFDTRGERSDGKFDTRGERSDGKFDTVSPEEVADFLAVLAHAATGFVGRAGSVNDVLALLSATVAALRGDDVRSAWTHPDVAALGRLRPPAAAAVREVLLGVEVADVAGAVAGLAVLGCTGGTHPVAAERPS